MPSLQDLEQFRTTFRSIGGEISALASRGEKFSDLELPDHETTPSMEQVDNGMDFSAFLDTIPDDLSTETDQDAASIPEDLLEGFADEIEEGRAESQTEDSSFELSEADFSFGEETEQDKVEETDLVEEPAGEEYSEAKETSETGEVEGELEDFDLPEEEGFSLFSEEVPESTEKPKMEAVPSINDPFDFSIPDTEMGAELPNPIEQEGSIDIENLAVETKPEGAAELPSEDSFDTFSLDDSTPSSPFDIPEGSDDIESDGLGELEEFSLPGIDDIFSGSAGTTSDNKPSESRPPFSAQEVEEIHLSEEEFGRLEDTLSSYPLNLRIACEELIAEQAVAPDLMSALIKALVRGAPAKETAALAGKILGRTIIIPRGFEKRTGEALEAEQATFSYMFLYRFLPVFKIFALIAVTAASLIYLSFEFIINPLRAEGLYKQGYERITVGEYVRANEHFSQAFRIRRKKPWFYKYAEAFIDERQFIHAQGKYDELLRYYPRDKKGVLDYAAMESEYLRNYSKADRLIRHNILDYSVDDREGLLALGDVNLAWGEIERERYEDARKAYARLIERYGKRDPYLERMLVYFIRVDNLAEVLSLQSHFMSSKRTKINASNLAEMGGYLLDKKLQDVQGVPDQNLSRIEGLREIFDRAIRLDPNYPEAHYHMAKYFNRFGSPIEEQEALNRALISFEGAPESSSRRIRYRIDAHRRLAALLKDNKEFISAEEKLVEGLRLYEDAVQRNILTRSDQFGRLYGDLGDIEYFIGGDLDTTLQHYQNARLNGWAPPELRYRVGSAHYLRREWKEAVESFFEASLELPLNRRLLFALGNASYMRGNYHLAQGYYERLLDLLETERARFPTAIGGERPEHIELAERIMRARNNLGVTLESLADRTGATALRSRALALYAESARAWDVLTRDPESMVRSNSTNLAYLNTRNSLYPEGGYEAQLYMEIDKDVLEPSPWEELLGKSSR